MEVPLGDTYYFLFTTRSFSTGAPTTLSGTPVLSVYEENNLTQITAGVAVSADYDSVTGLNECSIVATSGNGYEIGKYYSVVITTGTVGGVSVVGEVVGHFRIMPAEDAGAGIKDVKLAADVTHGGGTTTRLVLNNSGGADNLPGLQVIGDGTAAGAEIKGDTTGGTGIGLEVSGGATSGIGAKITGVGTGGHGLSLNSSSSIGVSGLWITGNTTGIRAAAQVGDAVQCVAGSNGRGLSLQGSGNEEGLYVEGGDTGDAFKIVGGATSGDGVDISVTSGNEISYGGTEFMAAVNAEVVDAINTDTYAEPGQGAPPATASLVTKIGHMYKSWRNKKDNDGSTTQLYDDAGTTVDAKQTTSESGGTVTKDEWVTGP